MSMARKSSVVSQSTMKSSMPPQQLTAADTRTILRAGDFLFPDAEDNLMGDLSSDDQKKNLPQVPPTFTQSFILKREKKFAQKIVDFKRDQEKIKQRSSGAKKPIESWT